MAEYADRDHMALGNHYIRHVSAMTAEGLHRKSDIAAELAWRDAEIERLRAQIAASAPAPAPAEPVAYWIPKAEQFCIAKPGEPPFAKAWQPLYAAPAAPAGWQPIETAPQTGRKIIVAYVNRNGKPRTVMARWLTDDQAAETDADDVGLEGGWYECIDNWGDYTEVAIHEGEPTHWMPIPAAPGAPQNTGS